MAEKIKELVRKRGLIKSKLTQFSSYLAIPKSCEKLSDAQIIELQMRVDKIENLYSEFDHLQYEIEMLAEQPDEHTKEREKFESQYFSLLASARELLGKNQKSSLDRDEVCSSGSGSSKGSSAKKHNYIRLPQIEIPKFSGSYQSWLEFRDTFISMVHSRDDMDNINKLHFLRASLKGSALLVIDNLDFKADNYESAWKLLCDRYDNKRLLVNNHVQALFNVEQIHKESSKALRFLVDVTNKNLRALATLDQPTSYWDTLIIHMMSTKLDNVTYREWEESRNTLSSPPDLTFFINFLSGRADLLESIEESRSSKTKPESYSKPKSFVLTSNQPRVPACPMCQQGHHLFNCPTFRGLPVSSRITKAKECKACLNCLRMGHTEAQCKLSHCKYCKIKHNTLLHEEKKQDQEQKPKTDNDNNVVFSANHSSSSRVVLLSTALVKVYDSQGKHHTARVLLDNGSTANFISEDLCNKLKLKTHTTQSKVTGINNQASNSCQSCSLKFESFNGNFKMDIDCFVLPEITSKLPNTHINIQDLPIPSGVCLADPSFNVPSSINLLVGAEVFWGIIGTNRIDLGKNKPSLFESKLGWLVSGVMHQSRPKGGSSLCMFVNNNQNDQKLIEPNLSRFWELDTIPSKHDFTSEERACEENFINTTFRDADGRFVVSVPLKESPDVLGDSYYMAKRRFLSLERRLQQDPNLKSLYVDFMDEYINLGHMSENNNPMPTSKPSYYMPHHGVLRESSLTTKLRVVFDASAKTTSGKSYNDIQMVGPVVQDDLVSILLRFRQNKFVVCGDIEKMYRQSWINEEHRSLQQILWRPDPNLPIKTYTLNTVSYGTASAPFLATRCLNQLAQEAKDPLVQQAIAHDFYVDDFLSGAKSVAETVHLCRGVVETLNSAQFNLRKWQSNSKDILDALCHDKNDSELVNLSANELSKTLGLNWRCFDDTFTFSINLPSKDVVTKRHILSIIAQIYDPLGLVVPCIVEAKIIMQQLWIIHVSWDECVPPNIKKAWANFELTLPHLNTIQIPRFVTCKTPSSLQLHVFTDASEKAYGACVYVRSIDEDDSVHVDLLTAKSKVAPIKSQTIPRLELCGALLGSRLCTKVLSSLTLNFSDCIFWCDSTIVLGWLSALPTHLKSFVRNRVCEIREGFPNSSWRYVPSQENPADLASRGLSADKLSSSDLWWSGPSFLRLPQSQWPSFPNSHGELVPDLPETIVSLFTTDNQLFNSLITNISNFTKLQRITAYIFRFTKNCRSAQTKNQNSLSSSELNHASNFLIKISQKESFPEEFKLLKKGKELPHKNRLLSLSPFLDSEDIIRVGGRLDNSFYDYNVKHPILLCSKHRLTSLLFEMMHKRLYHAGPQLLLATVRHNYWALGGRNLAKKTVRLCVKCCRLKAQTVQPIMGNLPEQRIQLEFPFLETGVDYAGPILIANRKGRGCSLIKCFISVFVCLATRAVHLELVSDMTKEAFIAALNRFISRRGMPRNIYSDNGTTFVGAFNELSQLLLQDLTSDYSTPGLNFSFIPAYTPHFGGIWESAVKAVKHHLRRTLGLTNLTYEEMATCLIQVEAILNSRPLTPISDDPSDLVPLTPAHFLIGRSLTMMPHPKINDNVNITSLQRFRRIEYLKQHFWQRFSHEYIFWLQQKTKWCRSEGSLEKGSMVVIKEKTLPPMMWLLGRIIRVFPGQDGVARVAMIQTKKGVIRRAYNTICPLPVKDFENTSRPGVCP